MHFVSGSVCFCSKSFGSGKNTGLVGTENFFPIVSLPFHALKKMGFTAESDFLYLLFLMKKEIKVCLFRKKLYLCAAKYFIINNKLTN